MKNGIFISFEGPDGSGKTTQIERLAAFLKEQGYECLITREPGGTAISEAVRGILLDPAYKEMDYMTEAMLYASARAQLVAEVIRPALSEGKAVISDRFVDSSVVYQGIARGLGIDEVYRLNGFAIQGLMPSLTIHLDLSAEEGIRRKKNQAELDRLEQEDISFHAQVTEGYRTLAKLSPDRIRTIDATLPVEVIEERIRALVQEEFGK